MRFHFVILNLGVLASCLLAQETKEAPVLFPEPLSPRIANYNIDVRLDVETKMLDGQEVLVWHNKSNDTIRELQFHLYLNAFRNNRSTFVEESGGQLRGDKMGEDGWGFVDVTSFKLNYGSDLKGSLQYIRPSDAPEVMDEAYDLTADMRFIQPDNDNENDKTVFMVPLPKPLQPGDFVAVKMDFTAKLPDPPFARTGAKEEYFLVGQWFPKVGVYTDKGWNTHQFHANSEFFADYGVYNVRMTLPDDYVVGATGLEVSVTDNGDGTATHFYHAEDVHDFSWTASPEFVEFTGKAQDVDIRVLMQPDHAYQGQRHLDAAIIAVSTFQDWYGDYPFPNLTVVDPRRKAGGSGGMEYPTLITAGTRYGLPEGLHLVEMVIIHEFGHNYWYHLLASNEFEESWMDEGINTYTDIQINNAAYGEEGNLIDVLGIKLSNLQASRMQVIFGGGRDPIIRRAWEFYSGGSYGVNSYAKSGIVLTTLKNYVGADVMRQIMRTYVERWRFKHPTSEDYFAIVNEVSGQDMRWFIEQAFYSPAVLDYSVARVFTREAKKAKGYDYTVSTSPEDSSITAVGDEDEELVAAAMAATNPEEEVADSLAEEDTKMYYSGINIRRLGEFKFPVDIEIIFADGEIIREQWDGRELWKKLRYTRPAKLISATVDPDFKIPLDVNYTNNSKTVKKQNLGVNKLSARTMFWMQFLLEQPDFMNLLQMPRAIFD